MMCNACVVRFGEEVGGDRRVRSAFNAAKSQAGAKGSESGFRSLPPPLRFAPRRCRAVMCQKPRRRYAEKASLAFSEQRHKEGQRVFRTSGTYYEIMRRGIWFRCVKARQHKGTDQGTDRRSQEH